MEVYSIILKQWKEHILPSPRLVTLEIIFFVIILAHHTKMVIEIPMEKHSAQE